MVGRFTLSDLVVAHPTPEDQVNNPNLINFTESSITPRTINELGLKVPTDLPLEHGREKGLLGLSTSLAKRCSVGVEDILVTVGASAAVYFVQTALLGPGDHLVIMRPNYPLNIDGAHTTGCEVSYYDLDFDKQFKVEMDKIEALIKPNTKLISICNPCNPAGTIMSVPELQALAAVAEKHNIYLLVDETYSDLQYVDRLPGAASLGKQVIGVSSMSKTWGVSGLRVGWISTTNQDLMDTFVAAKQIISITAGIIDESLAEQIMEKSDELRPPIIAEVKRRRDLVEKWVESESELIEWLPTSAGTTAFIRVKKEPEGGMEAFYQRLRKEHQTAVLPGRCFESPNNLFRIGFGYPPAEKVPKGLEAISKALRG